MNDAFRAMQIHQQAAEAHRQMAQVAFDGHLRAAREHSSWGHQQWQRQQHDPPARQRSGGGLLVFLVVIGALIWFAVDRGYSATELVDWLYIKISQFDRA